MQRRFTDEELEELQNAKMTGSHYGRVYGCKCPWCIKMNEILERKLSNDQNVQKV